jgi:hypothetical protein
MLMSRDLERRVDVMSAFVSHGEDDRYEELIKKKARAERTRFGHIDGFRNLGFTRNPVKGDDLIMNVRQIVLCAKIQDSCDAMAQSAAQEEVRHGY